MKFLRFEQLKDYGVDWSRIHCLRLEKQGKFPKRVVLGENSIRYLESEIVSWLKARVAERDKPRAPSTKGRKPLQQGEPQASSDEREVA